MPISERWRKFPATRWSRFLFFAFAILAFMLAYAGAYLLTGLINGSLKPLALWHYLLVAFALTTLITTMAWLGHQAERGEITRRQRKIAGAIALTGGALCFVGAFAHPWLAGEIFFVAIMFACCGVALVMGWFMARRNQRRSGAPQNLS